MSNRGGLLAGVAILMIALTGCSDDTEPEEFPLDTMPARTSAPDADPTGGTPTEEPTGTAELPRECSAIIAYTDVLDAVAVPLSGGVSPIFIDGGFHEASGRLQRLTCSYNADPSVNGNGGNGGGDDGEQADVPPVLEIAVSSYVDAEHAETRVTETVAGAGEAEPQEISGSPGYVLRSEESITFVAADGPLTYVASLTRGLVPEDAERVVLIKLAEHLLGGDNAASGE